MTSRALPKLRCSAAMHAEQEQSVSVIRLCRESLETELVGEAEVAPVQRALRLALPLSYHAVGGLQSS